MDGDDHVVAAHQAAYAVMAAWFGGSTGKLEVKGRGAGKCDVANLRFDASDYTEEVEAYVRCAGRLAYLNWLEKDEDIAEELRQHHDALPATLQFVRRYRFNPWLFECEDGAWTLWRLASSHKEATDEELIATYKAYEAAAAKIMDSPDVLRAIWVVAIALLGRGKLRGDEVREAITAVSPEIVGRGVSHRAQVTAFPPGSINGRTAATGGPA
jgi:hypothetical protein